MEAVHRKGEYVDRNKPGKSKWKVNGSRSRSGTCRGWDRKPTMGPGPPFPTYRRQITTDSPLRHTHLRGGFAGRRRPGKVCFRKRVFQADYKRPVAKRRGPMFRLERWRVEEHLGNRAYPGAVPAFANCRRF